MMASQRLRVAARVLREQAEAATPGPWVTHARGWDDDPEEISLRAGTATPNESGCLPDSYMSTDLIAEEDVEYLTSEEAQQALHTFNYIATMHPGVGLALADFLDALGLRYENVRGGPAIDPPPYATRIADLILRGEQP